MFSFAFFKPFLPYILGALAIGGAYIYADHFWHNAVAQKAEKELDTLKTNLAKEALRQKENALRADQNQAQRNQTNEKAKNARFAPLKDRPVPAGTIPAAVVSVLNAAASGANASGTPSKPEAGAAASATDASFETLKVWGVTVLEIHAECRDRVLEWERWYEDLRNGH